MPRNKPRLQLALYARPKHPGSYHYALLVAPKDTTGPITKHHVKNTLQVDSTGEATQPWRYEGEVVPGIDTEPRLLVRVVIAKVTGSRDVVQQILENVPVYQTDVPDRAKAQSFNCRTWVWRAFEELRRQNIISVNNLGNSEDIERNALEYLDRKRKQRRWSGAWNGGSGVPLMDLLESKELIE